MRATELSKLLLKALRNDSNAAASTPLTIQAATSQSADLIQVLDASGNLLYRMDPTGRTSFNGAQKTIVDGSATSLIDIACAAGAMVGGVIHYTVRASDGTDYQALTGMVTYSAVNKAGTLTLTITELATNQAKAVSSGTLTLAWTFVTGTNKGTIKLTPTGSLTETTYDVTFTINPILGVPTIL